MSSKLNWFNIAKSNAIICVVIAIVCALSVCYSKTPNPRRRSDGYCSINTQGHCVETGTSCQDQGNEEIHKGCANWLPADDVNFCMCLQMPCNN